MSDGLVWAEIPGEDPEPADAEEQDTPGDVDETMATRRLRHWLQGMFGGRDRPPNDESESG